MNVFIIQLRRVTALLVLLFVATSLPVQQAAANDAEKARREAASFCQTLGNVNNGQVDVTGLPELAGHARIVNELLKVAPATIAGDLGYLYDIFNNWANAALGKGSMLVTFAQMQDTQFAAVQGRIADYIAEHCGLRRGSGHYHVGSQDRGRYGKSSCPAWPNVGNPATFNFFPTYPDISGGNYFSQRFWIRSDVPAPPGMFQVEPGGRVELKGQYFRARYFAFHPNDDDLNNLKTLRDKDLNPDAGSVNPFRQVPTAGSKNTFTARLVFTQPPANPDANTSYVGAEKNGIKPTSWISNMLRLYASDLGNGPNSGGVPLPAMTIYNAAGEITEHYGECDLFANGYQSPTSDVTFPVLPIADHRAVNPPNWNTSSNYDAPTDTLANADSQYLNTFYSYRHGDIFVVRAKKLLSPNSREGEAVSSAGKDIRLYTLCTYNIWSGAAQQCLLDQQLQSDSDGYYTLVVSDKAHRPDNLDENNATWIDWGDYLDGQLTYRLVYRDNPFARAIAFALNGGTVAEEMQAYVPKAVACTQRRFESGGWQACY